MAKWQFINTTDGMLVRIINGLKAICTQSYREMNAKRGLEWEASREITATSNGQKFYSVIKVGSTYPIDLKARVIGSDGVGVVGRIYEIQDSDVTLGTHDSWYNFRFDITTQPDAKLYAGANITFITPVISLAVEANKRGADIVFRSNSQNTAKGVELSQQGANRIIYQDRLALLELESLDAQSQFIQAYLEMYEGGLDFPNEDLT